MHGEPPIVECKLPLPELRAQRERYRTLSQWVDVLDRAPGRLQLHFSDDVDERLLDQTLDIERGCCTFLTIAHHPEEHQVTIGVSDPSQDPALDALVFTLGAQT